MLSRISPSQRTRTGGLLLLWSVFAWLSIGTSVPLSADDSFTGRIAAKEERARARLKSQHPEVQIDRAPNGRTWISQKGMAAAPSPELAAASWLQQFSGLLSCEPDDLELQFVAPLGHSGGVVFAYQLSRGGYPVEGGAVRLVIAPGEAPDSPWAVASVASALSATVDLSESVGSPAVLPRSVAQQIAQRALPGDGLTWREPELVVVPDRGEPPTASLLWRVAATDDERSKSWWVWIDPQSGEVAELRPANLELDISGELRIAVSPAPRPDLPSNPPVSRSMVGAEVEFSGGSTMTDAEGNFQFVVPGLDPAPVSIALVSPWVVIEDTAGPDFVWTGQLSPGQGPILLEAAGDPLVQAQLNAFYYTQLCYKFFRDRTDGIPGLDQTLHCRVNLNDTCNANYDPIELRLNFFASGGGCANAAYSSVVAHEYGHFVVQQLGLMQGAFGEGFGDTVSMLLLDDPLIGLDFEGLGTAVRDPVAAQVQSPCFNTIHHCGQTLSSVWWQIRESLGGMYSPELGLEMTRQLFVDWALTTVGVIGTSSADAQTVLEVLTVDDDDGDLSNGTPHYFAICDAFAAHGLACPPAPEVLFFFPSGRPELLLADEPTPLEVTIDAGALAVDPATAFLRWRPVGGVETTVSPVESGGVLVFELPAVPCGETIEYHFSIDDLQGDRYTSPALGGGQPFRVTAYSVSLVEVSTAFEGDAGWALDLAASDATSGDWERGVPIGSLAAPAVDLSAAGDECWVTGLGVPGGALGAADVDGGTTVLRSPTFDLTLPGRYEVSYGRWFSNHAGANPGSDLLRVEVSFDGGSQWEELETVGPSGAETEGGWLTARHRLNPTGAPPGFTSFRVSVSDLPPGSLVEAGFDEFEIRRWSCLADPEFVRGDTNLDLSIGIVDAILCLEYLFLSGTVPCVAAVDYNADGQVALLDAILLLNTVFFGPAPLLNCVSENEGGALTCLGDPPCAP